MICELTITLLGYQDTDLEICPLFLAANSLRDRSPGPAARWLLRWIWPSLVRYPCLRVGLHCHVRHATWPLETALQLEAGWGPYLSSTEGLEALPGLPRETG